MVRVGPQYPLHNLLVNCQLVIATMTLFNRNGRKKKKKKPKIHMEPLQTLNNQSNFEQEDQSWRYHTS